MSRGRESRRKSAIVEELFSRESVRLMGKCEGCGLWSSSVLRCDSMCSRCFNHVAQKKTVGLAKGTRGQLAGKNPSGGARVVPPENDPFHGAATLADAGIGASKVALALVPTGSIPGGEGGVGGFA